MALPERSQRVGVKEGDAPLLKIKAHAEPGRQRVGEARGGGRAVDVGDGISDTVAVVMVVIAVLGQIYFAHSHGEEAERWSGVQSILCSAVVAAVWVIAAG